MNRDSHSDKKFKDLSSFIVKPINDFFRAFTLQIDSSTTARLTTSTTFLFVREDGMPKHKIKWLAFFSVLPLGYLYGLPI